jgi:hypothetical protein
MTIESEEKNGPPLLSISMLVKSISPRIYQSNLQYFTLFYSDLPKLSDFNPSVLPISRFSPILIDSNIAHNNEI